MQVLGSLIKLPTTRDALPLPWWHRAPLGLLDRTTVYLALVASEKRPVGNLIVSVLNPSDWNNMVVVEGQEDDQPGVIEKAFSAAFPFNIAVAETATTEAGNQHDVSVVCEPFGGLTPDNPLEHITSKLAVFELQGLRARPFLSDIPSIIWHDVFQVDHGWIRDTGWQERLREIYGSSIGQVDLERAVVSADTERRLLRFLFPRKDAITIRVEHADRPGALRSIAQIFRQSGLNVLTALLRRGGAKSQNAVIVATCEPHNVQHANLRERLATAFVELPQDLRAHHKILEPEDPEALIYSHHPDELVARVPNSLRPLVVQYKKNLPTKGFPIFISRRFLSSPRRDRIVQRVHACLQRAGCIPLEAQPEPGQLSTSLMQVSAKMWLARAGIVLVAGGVDQSFSMNLAHEAGFLQGQGKPILVLVEDGSERGMENWTNAYGLVAPRFPADDHAFDHEDQRSIDAVLGRWITSLRRHPEDLV